MKSLIFHRPLLGIRHATPRVLSVGGTAQCEFALTFARQLIELARNVLVRAMKSSDPFEWSCRLCFARPAGHAAVRLCPLA